MRSHDQCDGGMELEPSYSRSWNLPCDGGNGLTLDRESEMKIRDASER